MSEKKYIQSIERASEILHFIANRKSAKLQEICLATGLKKTTAFGILQTLEHTGQVMRSFDNSGYTLGIESLSLGLSYLDGSGMTSKIRELLNKLVEDIEETAYFVLKVGDKYYFLDSVISNQPLKVVPEINRFYEYPDFSAVGKVFLNTDKSFTYATDLEGVYQGVNCFAAGYYANQKVVGAIVVTGPSNRYDKVNIEKTYEHYKEVMKELGLSDHLFTI